MDIFSEIDEDIIKKLEYSIESKRLVPFEENIPKNSHNIELNPELVIGLCEFSYHSDAVAILVRIFSYFKNSDDTKQQVFDKLYLTILTVCFKHFDITNISYKNFIRLIFLLDTHVFKIFAIQYMFVNNTHAIISEYYEDKRIILCSRAQFAKERVIKAFGKYYIPLEPSNFKLYKVSYTHKEPKENLEFSFMTDADDSLKQVYVPTIILPIVISEDAEEFEDFVVKQVITQDHKTMRMLSGLYNIATDEYNMDTDRQGVVIRNNEWLIGLYKECFMDYLRSNKKNAENVFNIIRYYTHIGDTCIHNILRGKAFMNDKDRCEKTNDEIIHHIKELNNLIWNRDIQRCHPQIPFKLVLYRGTKLINVPLTKGSIINSLKNQFVSFSSSYEVANSFGDIVYELRIDNADKFKTIIPIEDISLPNQQEATYFSKFHEESEWLLPINTSFKVIGPAVTTKYAVTIIPIKIHNQEKTEYKEFSEEDLEDYYDKEIIMVDKILNS